MAYNAQVGIPLVFFHPVLDLAFQPVSGQAGSVTQALIGPDLLPASEVATLTDAAAGWVRVAITLTGQGVYQLTLTNPNPPTADGGIFIYPIQVSQGILAATNLLTSLDRVRERMQLTDTDRTTIAPGDTHPWDSVINSLISEVSDEYQQDLGRTFAQQVYTEYLDGSGRPSLILGAGPIVSVTSVESIAYEDDGAGGVTETATTVERHTYVIAGLITQPRYIGLGRIDRLGASVFTRGPRKFKVVYTAGFAAVPEKVVGIATSDVVYRMMTRESSHMIAQSLGDGNISYLGPQRMMDARQAALDPYRLERVA